MRCMSCIYLREDYEEGEEGVIGVERFCINKLSKKSCLRYLETEKCPYYEMIPCD